MRKTSLVTLKFSSIVCIMILLLMFIMSSIILNLTKNSFIKEMEIRAEFFARSAREALFPKADTLRLYFLSQEMIKEKAILYAMVLDEEGKIISHNDKNIIGTVDKSAVGLAASGSRQLINQEYKDKEKNNLYDIAVPIKIGNGEKTKKVGAVRIGYSAESISKALEPNRRKIIIITFFSLLFGILCTTLIVIYMAQPI